MPKKQPWYVEFFRDDYVRYWLGGELAALVSSERTAQEVAFMEDALALPAGASVLDLCCGHGRHAVALAQKGYRITGLDLSAYHLRLARQAAARAKVDIEWVRADMREIPQEMTGRFDAVINMFTSFGFLESEAEDQKVLDGVARALKPGGKFVIDFINREWVIRQYQEREWKQQGDVIVLEQRRFDLATGRNTAEATVVEADGSKRSFEVVMRMYTAVELISMLRAAGLRWRRLWGDFDGRDLSLDSRRLIVLSEKTGAAT
jgi:SAM-dependent methyltransferase